MGLWVALLGLLSLLSEGVDQRTPLEQCLRGSADAGSGRPSHLTWTGERFEWLTAESACELATSRGQSK